MRRSSRAVKKPEVFNPTGGKGVEQHDTDDEDNDGGSGMSSEENDGKTKKSKKSLLKTGRVATKSPTAPVAALDASHIRKGKKRVSIQAYDDSGSDMEQEVGVLEKNMSASKVSRARTKGIISSDNTLFNCVQGTKKVTTAAAEWAVRHTSSKIKSNTELVNFLLLSGGARKSWIRPEEDLESLDAEELLELLADMVADMTAQSTTAVLPLSLSPKQRMKSFRDRYVLFWTSLAASLCSPTEREISERDGFESLNSLLALITPFSTMNLANIRLAATLALLAISREVQRVVANERSQEELTRRQLGAEGRSTDGRKSSKHAALEKQVKEYEIRSQNLSTATQEVFSTVFTHRYKDTAEEVREACAAHLGPWLLSCPPILYKDDYLKYLGWMCSDQSASVRLCTVQSIAALLDSQDYLSSLSSFIGRFTERFAEMSMGDVSDAVALETIKLIRKLQSRGLLDEAMSEEQLDLVDEVVFDEVATLAVRREALSFMFDHTEGFDNESLSAVVGGEAEDMARRQRTALQLETVCEFVEHHLGSDTSRIDLFVEACMGLPQSAVITDWSTIMGVLLRDHTDAAPALSALHVLILIRMLSCSANLTRAAFESNDKEKRRPSREWTSLTECLQDDLPRLLTRFKDNEQNLRTLTELLGCFGLATINAKQFRPTLKVLIDLFEASSRLEVLQQISLSLHNVCRDADHLKVAVESALSVVHTSQLKSIAAHTRALAASPTGESKKSRLSKGEDGQDDLYSLCYSLSRFLALWQNYDCRPFLLVGLDETFDELIEAAEVLMNNLSKADTIDMRIQGCKSAVKTLYLMLLWCTRDVYVEARSNFGHKRRDDDNEGAHHSIETILDLRDKLVDCLHTMLDLGKSDTSSVAGLEKLNLECSLEAFRLVGDLRVLFSPRNASHKIVSALAWAPPPELITSLRAVFDCEGQRIQQEIESLGLSDRERSVGRSLSRQLVSGLLCPMGIATMYNIEQLNLMQAAAVLNYAAEADEYTQALIKAWSKKLKDFDPIKWLEVQLVALKQKFLDSIVSPQRFAEKDDTIDARSAINRGYASIDKLVTKLTHSYGPSKWKGEALTALENFHKMGISFSLSSSLHLGFIKFLSSYLRFLPVGSLRSLNEYLDSALADYEDLLDEMEDPKNASSEIKDMIYYRSITTGQPGKRLSRRRRSSMSTADSTSEANDSDIAAPHGITKHKSAYYQNSSSVTKMHSSFGLPTVAEETRVIDDSDDADNYEEYKEASKSSPDRIQPPKKTSQTALTPIGNDIPWSESNSKLSSIVKKYSSRSNDKIISQHTPSDSASDVKDRSPIDPPPFSLGLHIENIDISPIASDDSVIQVTATEKGRNLTSFKRKLVDESDDDISVKVSVEEAEKITRELKQVAAKRRR